jgi:creatinine amidohydrolase/Fe(II)-dependent formamide hydrolase-like protein
LHPLSSLLHSLLQRLVSLRFQPRLRPRSTRPANRTASPAAAALALLAALAVPAATAADDKDGVEEALAAPSPITAGASPWLEELTWMEIRDRIAAGTHTVIIPTGGIEENGPYLATGKHNLILEATCPAIAEALGNALCAPVVKFVPEGRIEPPEGAMRYPGTISLTPATYEALLVDIARSLKQAGFRHIVLIGDSGGNQAGMAAVAERLGNAWAGSGTAIHFVREYYDPGWSATEDYTRETLGVRETRHDGYHDDIWVTAMMMVTDPTQVRFDERVAAGLASINGVPLEPLEDTVALGRAMIDFRARFTADAIRRAVAAHD